MVEVDQIWRKKRTGKLFRVEKLEGNKVSLRETELTTCSPPEGTLYVTWMDMFLALHEWTGECHGTNSVRSV